MSIDHESTRQQYLARGPYCSKSFSYAPKLPGTTPAQAKEAAKKCLLAKVGADTTEHSLNVAKNLQIWVMLVKNSKIQIYGKLVFIEASIL